MIPTEIDQLLAHMEWADALAWTAVLDTPGTDTDERVGSLLHHAHTVQAVYLRLWRGEPIEAEAYRDSSDLDEAFRLARGFHRALPDFVATLDEETLERDIDYPWAEQLAEAYGEVHPTTLRQSLLQIAHHSTYHRGQVATRLRELGGEPPLTDFVAWVWAGRPAAEWPEAET